MRGFPGTQRGHRRYWRTRYVTLPPPPPPSGLPVSLLQEREGAGQRASVGPPNPKTISCATASVTVRSQNRMRSPPPPPPPQTCSQPRTRTSRSATPAAGSQGRCRGACRDRGLPRPVPCGWLPAFGGEPGPAPGCGAHTGRGRVFTGERQSLKPGDASEKCPAELFTG